MSTDIYYSLAEHSPHATFIYDLETKQFLYSNNACRLLLGVDVKQVPFESILSLIPHHDLEHLKYIYKQFITGKIIDHIEFRVVLDHESKTIRLTPASLPA